MKTRIYPRLKKINKLMHYLTTRILEEEKSWAGELAT